MRTFTSDGEVFHGFDRNFDLEAKRFALTMVEGEPEIWVVDNILAIDELDRYYTELREMPGLHFKVLCQYGFWSNPKVSKEEAFPSSWKTSSN